jgi:glycine betaine catabolism B
MFDVPTNVESVYISALILALIVAPIQSYADLWFLGWVAVLAMASKYILAIKGKHVFNPVAFAVALTYISIYQPAHWWVGTLPLLPFVILGGLAIVRKVRRFDLVLSFMLTALGVVLIAALLNGRSPLPALQSMLLYSSFFFLAFVMLTEPLTSPPTRKLRLLYGALVGLLFTPTVHIGPVYTTPELALLIGNVFSFLVSPKAKVLLKLKAKERIAPGIYEFVFSSPRKFGYHPGQYMEWTLEHPNPDSRGNRRYFTLASAPTEGDLRLGVKYYENSSSFKKALFELEGQLEIVAGQVAGDFVLPKDPAQKCVFLAGGVGITPFRSMIQYLLDIHQPRPIVLFYACRTAHDVAYKTTLDRAERELGITVVYALSDTRNPPHDWEGRVGRVNPEWIRRLVPNVSDCKFFISGPPGMIAAHKKTLRQVGVPITRIKTDYFPGLS